MHAQKNSLTLADMGLYLLKSSDFHKKQIESVDIGSPTSATVTYKDGKKMTCRLESYLPAADTLSDCLVYCANTKDNVENLIGDWSAYAAHPALTITFLDVKSGNKWSIKPYLHNRIAEAKKLRVGIMAMFEQSLVPQ